MKSLSRCLFVVLLALPAARAELEQEIPLGMEAVTGARSSYVYRGFDLAGPLLDFQIEGEAVLRDDVLLNAGGWIGTELGGDFSEGAGFLDLRYDFHTQFTAGVSATYHVFDHSLFDDGFDLGAFLTWYPTEDWEVTSGVYRNLGADAWYANAETSWSHRLSDDAHLGLTGGISAVEDYYGRSGFNDFYGRATLTYNLARTVSLTPFLGWSLELEEEDGNELFGGLWFEVSF